MLHAKETHRDCDMVRELRSLFTGTPVCTVDQVHRTKHDACAEDTRRAMYGITEALGFTFIRPRKLLEATHYLRQIHAFSSRPKASRNLLPYFPTCA